MKFAAILFCVMPWLVAAIGCSVLGVQEAIQVFGLLWMVVSPIAMAGGLLVAYRHGQWSVRT